MTEPAAARREPDGLWAHVGEWTAVAVTACYTVAVLARAVHWPGWLPAVAAVTAGVVAASSSRAAMSSGPFTVWLLTWGLLATGWEAYTRFFTPWSPMAACLLCVPAAILVPAGVMLLRADHSDTDAMDAAAAARMDAEHGQRYSAILERAGYAGCVTTGIATSAAGDVVSLTLPASGSVTLSSLAEGADKIETAGRLRRDSLRFEGVAADSSRVVMHVVKTDVLAADIPYPDDMPPLSVSRPLPIGVREDGQVTGALLREVAALIVGIMGSGKSNLLNVLIAGLARCPDAVIWMIDFKGGRLAAPWVLPWVTGNADRPVIDWVATTRAEAEVMMDCLETYLNTSMQSLSGGSKVEPGAGRPSLVLIGDEIADLIGLRFGARAEGKSNLRFADQASEINRKSRSEAIVPIWATQRGTNSMLGTGDLKAQCKLRVALGVTSEMDARSVIPDDSQAARLLAGLVHPGTGLVWMPGRRKPLPVKFYRLDPGTAGDLDRIHQMAATLPGEGACPELWQPGVDAMGEAYTSRWERSDLYQKLAAQGAALAVGSPPGGSVTVADPPAAQARSVALSAADVQDAFAAITGRDDVADLRDLDGGVDSDGHVWTGGGGGRVHPAYTRIQALLASCPVLGLSVPEIMARLGKEQISVRRETVYDWLNKDHKAGRVTRTGTEKSYRYKLAR